MNDEKYLVVHCRPEVADNMALSVCMPVGPFQSCAIYLPCTEDKLQHISCLYLQVEPNVKEEAESSVAAVESDHSDEESDDEGREDQVANAILSECFADYEAGGYSPQYLVAAQLDPGTIITAEEDDMQRLVFARIQVQGLGSKVEVSTLGLYIKSPISLSLNLVLLNYAKAGSFYII